MAKRFIDTSSYKQAWRKLDPRLRAAYFWIAENCDAAGYWRVDMDFFKFECGYSLDAKKMVSDMGGAVAEPIDGILQLVDFIAVNYGELKTGYNPHKPAFRALATFSALMESSSSQASSKLEEEGEEEGEDNSEEKERASATPTEPEAPFVITWPEWAGPKTLEKWEEFKVYRLEIHKAKYKSPKTEQRQVNLLGQYYNCGQDCVAALDKAMGREWLFPVDPKELEAKFAKPAEQE